MHSALQIPPAFVGLAAELGATPSGLLRKFVFAVVARPDIAAQLASVKLHPPCPDTRRHDPAAGGEVREASAMVEEYKAMKNSEKDDDDGSGGSRGIGPKRAPNGLAGAGRRTGGVQYKRLLPSR